MRTGPQSVHTGLLQLFGETDLTLIIFLLVSKTVFLKYQICTRTNYALCICDSALDTTRNSDDISAQLSEGNWRDQRMRINSENARTVFIRAVANAQRTVDARHSRHSASQDAIVFKIT